MTTPQNSADPRQKAGQMWPPAYFIQDGAQFVPTRLARSPWSAGTIAGGPVSAMLAHIAEREVLNPQMGIARFSVDILGTVPNQPLDWTAQTVRQGRQMQLHRVQLLADGRVVAQAHILQARHLDTPAFPAPHDYPDPQSIEDASFLIAASRGGAVRTRPVLGSVRQPGRGICWFALDGEVVSGITPSPFIKAALFGDFGNGVGSATDARDWSFANLDITLQFLRLPVGEWLLLDAETHGAGNGFATASSIFADQDGIFARGFQTVFVAPGMGMVE